MMLCKDDKNVDSTDDDMNRGVKISSSSSVTHLNILILIFYVLYILQSLILMASLVNIASKHFQKYL